MDNMCVYCIQMGLPGFSGSKTCSGEIRSEQLRTHQVCTPIHSPSSQFRVILNSTSLYEVVKRLLYIHTYIHTLEVSHILFCVVLESMLGCASFPLEARDGF